MKVVIEQSKLEEERITYQAEVPYSLRCRKCKNDHMILLMQVHDDEGEIVKQRPEWLQEAHVKVWPHDASVTSIYLCTNCGVMRANWNQG